MDLLSELFRDVQVVSTLFGRIEGRGGWALGYPASTQAGFHVVHTGACWVHPADGRTPIALSAGDFIVFPRGLSHEVRGDAVRRPFAAPSARDVVDVAPAAAPAGHTAPVDRLAIPVIARLGLEGPASSYLCGALTFSGHGAEPLLAALPDVICVRGESGHMLPWLESHVQAIACELNSDRAGGAMVIGRLSEVLFVQAIRSHLADLPLDAIGWPAAARDPQVSHALTLMHREPERDWTIASLGHAVAMSRSAFAARFQTVMGQAPLQYLTAWRMHRARAMLRDPSVSIAQIADRVGYASAAAFTTAFKRATGAAPATWRRQAA
jgi:AraC family transcriptional regulator, alkane utilization regulator